MNNIINYLEQLKDLNKGTRQSSIATQYYGWLISNGKSFTKVKIPQKQGQAKKCYYNSIMASIEDNTLGYYEGYGITKQIGIPFEHGFNVKNNVVIDYTWSDGELYFGIQIPIKYVMKHMFKYEVAETLLFRYFHEHIYKKETKNEYVGVKKV